MIASPPVRGAGALHSRQSWGSAHSRRKPNSPKPCSSLPSSDCPSSLRLSSRWRLARRSGVGDESRSPVSCSRSHGSLSDIWRRRPSRATAPTAPSTSGAGGSPGSPSSWKVSRSPVGWPVSASAQRSGVRVVTRMASSACPSWAPHRFWRRVLFWPESASSRQRRTATMIRRSSARARRCRFSWLWRSSPLQRSRSRGHGATRARRWG